MAQNSMHNLTTLIKRLEAATSRLEDIATSADLPKDASVLNHAISPPPEPASAASAASIAPSPPVNHTPKQAPQEPLPETVEDFDAFISSVVEPYVQYSDDLGGLVAKQAADVLRGFRAQRKLLLIASKAKKPDTQGSGAAVYQNLLKPTIEALGAITELKESNRPDPLYNHLCVVADSIMVLAWVTVENRPHKHVEESLGSAQYFGNRILKEYKDKEPRHGEWLQAYYRIFRELADYVKKYFSNGLSWNPKGDHAEDVAKSLSASTPPPAPASAAGGAPPPPPPPPPPGMAPTLDVSTTKQPEPTSGSASSGLDAVFSELNRGEDVTKGLRKVDKSQMTHKNPSLRGSDPSLRAKSPAPGKKPKPESMRMKKPPRKELEGNKWLIENFEKEPAPIEIEASLTQSILVSRCNNTTLVIKGKANQITVENSNRLSIVVDTLVSTVDVVKAQNFALQVLGTIPTVMLDQVDGGILYFSKESIATKVFTSKSAGINISIITSEDGDSKEVPLPSQICSYFDQDKGDLVNEIVAHAG